MLLVRQGACAPARRRGGRPSIDPVVFFKLQLDTFFEDLRSERRLMRAMRKRKVRGEPMLAEAKQRHGMGRV